MYMLGVHFVLALTTNQYTVFLFDFIAEKSVVRVFYFFVVQTRKKTRGMKIWCEKKMLENLPFLAILFLVVCFGQIGSGKKNNRKMCEWAQAGHILYLPGNTRAGIMNNFFQLHLHIEYILSWQYFIFCVG